MPIFARRRLQSMLDDLRSYTTSTKLKDIIARLEHYSTKDALAAEIELGVLWSISQVSHLEIDPNLPSSRSRPDAYSRNLFTTSPALIEITALSDDTFSGQDDMERAANIITQFASRTQKEAAQHLHFEFLEERRKEKGKMRRVRRITPGFKLTNQIEGGLRSWLKNPEWPNPNPLRITDPEIDVVITWKNYVHPHGRVFSSIPP